MPNKSAKNDYQVAQKVIGQGAYGKVHLAHDTSGKSWVVKKIDDLFDNTINAYRILREIKILKRLQNDPNIISLNDILPPEGPEGTYNSISLVFEKMDTDLAKLFESPQILTADHSKYFLHQLLCGINTSHSIGIVHRDLKPSNILVNKDCSLKICDFGLSRELDVQSETVEQSSNAGTAMDAPPPLVRTLTPHVVTRWYRAPEIIMGASNYSYPVDMWSVGCIFAEILMMQTKLLFRDPLFMGDSSFPLSREYGAVERSPGDQLKKIFDYLGTPTEEDLASICPNESTRDYIKKLPHTPPQDFGILFPYITDPDALDFLKCCLVINPNKRITAEQALQHPFIKDYNKYNKKLSSFSSFSASDRASFIEYSQFEILLEKKKQQGEVFDVKEIRKLISDEIRRYNPPVGNTLSVNVLSLEEKVAVAQVKESIPPVAAAISNRQLHNFFKANGYFKNNEALRKESFRKACTDDRNEYQAFIDQATDSFSP